MNFKVWKKSLISCIAIILIIVLSACGNGGTNVSGSPSPNNTEEPQKAAAKDPVELSLWNIWEGSGENQVFLNRAKAFQQAHPEIKLNIESTPHDQYKIKIKTLAAGKQLPDLFQVWAGAELTPLVDAGVIMPIDEIVDVWKDKIISADQLKDYAVNGKQYAIPGNKLFTHVIYYDKDMLAKAGYNEFPKTYEEFKVMIGKLRENGNTPIVLGNKGKWVLQSCFISTIGDRTTGSDFLKLALSGKKKFTDPEFVQALTIIEELTNLKAFNEDMNTIDNNQQRDYFLQGKGAMFIEGSWAYADLITKLPKGKNIGFAIFPSVAGGKGDATAVSGLTGSGIALNSGLTAEKKAAAYEFLKFFYSEDLYKELLSAGVLVPTNIAIPENANPLLKELVAVTSGKIAPVYDAVLTPQLTDIINNGLQAITIKTQTPMQVAEEMQKNVK